MDSSKPASRAGFPRSARLLARREFDAVFEQGRRAATAEMTLFFLADEKPPRLGLAVSRKVDTRAVVRNRIKRRLREDFRRQRESLAAGAYVVVARGRAAGTGTAELNQAFGHVLRRVGALPARSPDGTMPAACQSSASKKSDPASSSPASPPGDAKNSSAP